MFIFTGADYDAILSQFPKNPANRKAPDVAGSMDEMWTPALRNLADSFQIRVALDLGLHRIDMGGRASVTKRMYSDFKDRYFTCN